MHQPNSRSFRRQKAVAATGALVALLAFLPSTAAPAAEAAPLFEQIGTLERFPADARALLGVKLVPKRGDETDLQKFYGGTLIVVPQSRRLLQLFPDPSGAARTGIVIRDLDTLRISQTIQLNESLRRGSSDPAGGGDWAHALDNSGERIWLLHTTTRYVIEVNLKTLAVGKRALPGEMLGFPFAVGGMTYDKYSDDLLLLYSGPPAFSVANMNISLYRLDVSGPNQATFPREESAKIYRIRSCSGPVTSTDVGSDTSNWEILVTPQFLYVPCQRAGHTVVVIRLTRPDGLTNAAHAEDMTAGPVYGDSVLADPASGRLFVTTYRREIWVFETATMSFVGVVAAGPDNTNQFTGYGLDPETGRVFFQSKTFGLGVAEGRFFPIPQARTAPRVVTGQERIWSDARTSRVFVLEGDNYAGKAAAYRVYRTTPAPTPPAAPDPDRNTADMDEREGATEARYHASGSGYGTRVLLAKGIAGVPPQPVLGTEAPVAKELWTRPTLKPCDFTDRDIFAGRVAKAEYETGSTAAKAVAVAVDDATAQDLNEPERCNASLEALNGTRWDHTAAECASNQDHVPTEPSQGRHKTAPELGPSTATCRAPGQPLDASATSQLAGGIVEVERSWTTTTLARTSAGVVSTVESVAEGVTVGELRIGEVRSKAVSTSNGRPKRKNMSTHEITVADVRFGTNVVCESVCRDPVELEQRLNLLAGSRAVFRTGTGDNSGRDEKLVEGSDRGAQTAVQKSVARQASDRALIGDFTVEVPALEVTVFNDNTNWGRARQLYQFAGVASAATYNIVVNPKATAFEDPSSVSPGDGAPETPSTSFPDLVVAMDDEGFVLGPVDPTRVGRGDSDGRGGQDGTLVETLRAVARGVRLFLTSPRTALLFLTAWALLWSPAALSKRRRLLDLGGHVSR